MYKHFCFPIILSRIPKNHKTAWILDSLFLAIFSVIHKFCIFNYFNLNAYKLILNGVIYSLNEVQRLPFFLSLTSGIASLITDTNYI